MKKSVVPAFIIGAAVGSTVATISYIATKERNGSTLENKFTDSKDLFNEQSNEEIIPEQVMNDTPKVYIEDDLQKYTQINLLNEEQQFSNEEIEKKYETLLDGISDERKINALGQNSDKLAKFDAEALINLLNEVTQPNDNILEDTSDSISNFFEQPSDNELEETSSISKYFMQQNFNNIENENVIANFDADTFVITEDVKEIFLDEVNLYTDSEKVEEYHHNIDPSLVELEKLCETLVEKIS